MLISPVAIGALPLWSAIGAAVAAAVQPGGGGAKIAGESEPGDWSDAVRAATLFALLLELQGRDETTISRVLEGAIEEDDALGDGERPEGRARACAEWLDDVRHRFDLALAREARP